LFLEPFISTKPAFLIHFVQCNRSLVFISQGDLHLLLENQHFNARWVRAAQPSSEVTSFFGYLRSFDLSLTLGRPPLYFPSLVCVSQPKHRWLNEKKFSLIPWPSLEIHRRNKVRLSCSVQYLNNRRHGLNLSSTSGQADLIAQ
jgi:hypothetical protein